MGKKKPIQRRIGYARVSTRDQNLDLQIEALKGDGVLDDDLHVEKVSASSRSRKVLNWCLSTLRPGDVLVVWKLDRLSRSIVQMHKIFDFIKERGAGLHSITERLETETPYGKFAFNMMASLAELERDNTVFRTRAGIATAKAKGVRFGQPRKLSDREIKAIKKWRKDGATVREVRDRIKKDFKKTVSIQTATVWSRPGKR